MIKIFFFSFQGVGAEGKSVASTTARSSLNESTTIPMSARSVSFKEPIFETFDPPSSKSQQSTVVTVNRHDSVLEKLGTGISCI